MERRKRLFLLFLIVFFVFYCLSFPLFAESKTEVNIEGDNVKYQDDGKVIEADGDVRVTYKDLYLTAGHIFYYSGEKKIVAEKGFCLERAKTWNSVLNRVFI
ncbi:MAG: hypothetical protein NT099_08005 [Candidatus Saganbacteria bacterium]|nr:hypothetical protein [Candidatus Saganbacteria bacterium]